MNRDYLLEQFRLIDEYAARARSIAQRSREEFLGDKLFVDAAIRELTVLFETCYNIAKHLIASMGWKKANSKAEAFEILADMGVLPATLCDHFKEASRFRNLVTYQTAVVQDEIVYEVLSENLPDFEQFVCETARWIQQHIND